MSEDEKGQLDVVGQAQNGPLTGEFLTNEAMALRESRGATPNPFTEFPDPPEIIPDDEPPAVSEAAPGFLPMDGAGQALVEVAVTTDPAENPDSPVWGTHELVGDDGMAHPFRYVSEHNVFTGPDGRDWTREELDKRGTLRRVLPR